MGHLIVPPSRVAYLDSLEWQRQVAWARFELLSIYSALAEGGLYVATLGQVIDLYKRYILGLTEAMNEREAWQNLPIGQRPRNAKVARDRPHPSKEFLPLYAEAQALLEPLIAAGFNPLTWAQEHPGATHTLGGSDGLTYIRRAPGEKV